MARFEKKILYTNPMSIYCIWSSVDGVTLTSAQDIYLILAVNMGIYIEKHVLCIQ